MSNKRYCGDARELAKCGWTGFGPSRIIKVTDQVAARDLCTYVYVTVLYSVHWNCMTYMTAQSCFVLRRIIRYLLLFLLKIVPRIRPPRKVDDGSPRITAHHPLPDAVSSCRKIARAVLARAIHKRITSHRPRMGLVITSNFYRSVETRSMLSWLKDISQLCLCATWPHRPVGYNKSITIPQSHGSRLVLLLCAELYHRCNQLACAPCAAKLRTNY